MRRAQEELPAVMADAPYLHESLEFHYRAFWQLSTCRQIGMAVGPIPWQAVNDYALRHGIWDADFEHFEACIEGMDAAYLKWQEAKQEKGMGKKPAKKGRRR